MQARINSMNFSGDPQQDSLVQNSGGVHVRGHLYFDFKVPDQLSFPEALEKGLIMDEAGKILKDENGKALHKCLIIQTTPPYKPEYPQFLKTLAQRKSHG